MNEAHVKILMNFSYSCKLKVPGVMCSRDNHVGAVLADCILQAGLNYKYVVKPRVEFIRSEYPEAETTSGLLNVIEDVGASMLLQWCHPEKPLRYRSISNFFYVRSIETTKEMRVWLSAESNTKALLQLKGVGLKTIDYLRNLLGESTVAVDRHIRAFIQESGLELKKYEDIKLVIEMTADAMSVSHRAFDFAIWSYMSSRASR